ncbi:hypothetical protein [Paraburkholderia sp. BCC1886]|uniref:hypothetical protein n=1 Tax=Paraburkholderia sp. BCC1886 TaxID=2562670 RepID=UPI0011820CDD|nr:hypothetical protein [Paraburkholderia sp. BCC1886]
MYRQATLIQDIGEFRRLLEPSLQALFHRDEFGLMGCTMEDAFQWIIGHQIENVYGLLVHGHTRGASVYSMIHAQVTAGSPYPIDTLTSTFIKVPAIYDEQALSLSVRNRDLYLHYFLDTALIFNRP